MESGLRPVQRFGRPKHVKLVGRSCCYRMGQCNKWRSYWAVCKRSMHVISSATTCFSYSSKKYTNSLSGPRATLRLQPQELLASVVATYWASVTTLKYYRRDRLVFVLNKSSWHAVFKAIVRRAYLRLQKASPAYMPFLDSAQTAHPTTTLCLDNNAGERWKILTV